MLQPGEIQRLVKEAGVNAEMAKAVTDVCALDRRGIIHIQAALPALEFGQIKASGKRPGWRGDDLEVVLYPNPGVVALMGEIQYAA